MCETVVGVGLIELWGGGKCEREIGIGLQDSESTVL
jgi:hypothetical protein